MASFQILVVEDNLMQAKLASALLEEAGHTVQTAESAEKALELLRSFRPDLILMDLQLPGMDGLELTRALKLNPVHATTPIIAVTAYTNPSDLARAREAGCSGSISKPIDSGAFARQVRNFLGGASGASADVPSDSGDLLTEVRNAFLAEGLEQCCTILRQLQLGPGCTLEVALRVLHRWVGMGTTLGFPEISSQALKVEMLLTSPTLEYEEVVKAVETSRLRFLVAARMEPKLPLEVIRGLRYIRIGLIDFSDDEAKRIRSAASRANVPMAIEQTQNNSVDNQTGYGALIVNECRLSAQSALHRPQWSLPTVFIGSRASLASLSKLPSRAHDFLIAPWDAEEVLLRVYRLIGKTTPAQATGDSTHMQRRRSRILIADDDPDLVSLVSETLKEFGMDCEVARSGQQALDTVSRHQPDAIVLDVNMLDLDGFEVLKRLRHSLTTQAIPVLLLTARSQEIDIAQGFNSGADDYLVKPFKPFDLIERLNKMISARRKPRLAQVR
jgi:two-component system cell cycle response regulator DivK